VNKPRDRCIGRMLGWLLNCIYWVHYHSPAHYVRRHRGSSSHAERLMPISQRQHGQDKTPCRRCEL